MREDTWVPAGDNGFPQDLRAWVDESVLVSSVLEAVQSACESEEDSRRLTTRIPAGLPRIILTILTYSYAVGIYASEAIEARISSDHNLRYLTTGARPTWHDLRRFRRQNRPILHQALSKVLESAWAFKRGPASMFLQTDFRRSDLFSAANGAGPERSLVVAHAADDRINQAVLRDSMALDD